MLDRSANTAAVVRLLPPQAAAAIQEPRPIATAAIFLLLLGALAPPGFKFYKGLRAQDSRHVSRQGGKAPEKQVHKF